MKRIVFILMFLPFTLSAQDHQLESQAKEILNQLGVEYASVEVVDGNSNGGVKSVNILYKTPNDKQTRIQELFRVLETAYVLNQKSNANFDEVTAVIGSQTGQSLAIVTVKVNDVARFMRTKNAEEYARSMTALRFDKNYLANLLSLAKQD